MTIVSSMAPQHADASNVVSVTENNTEINAGLNVPAPISGFTAFSLAPALLRNCQDAGYIIPTPIQMSAIPVLLDRRDIIGIAQTGTGKTAAFALPMLHLHVTEPKRPNQRNARMIVLSPTRELAVQIAETFKVLSRGLRLTLTTIFGGVSERGQIQSAARGIDILVATPGRLLDLIERRHLTLEGTEVFVLDEADRMLDMGFIRDVRLLTKRLPKNRQSMMFSATMPPAIREVAEEMLRDPVKVAVSPKVVTVDKVAQAVYFIGQKQKPRLLLELLNNKAMSSVVVFTRTKHGANRVMLYLEKSGVSTDVIHGNKSQNARQAALNSFRTGAVRVLVATDIASRGIDVPGISHVINYELPDEPESYVHRIGRTARAGRGGEAIAFCDPSERSQLRQIERLTKVPLQVLTHPEMLSTVHGADNAAAEMPDERDERPARGRGGRGGSAPRREGSGRGGPRRESSGRESSGRESSGRDAPRSFAPRSDGPRSDARSDTRSGTRSDGPRSEGARAEDNHRPAYSSDRPRSEPRGDNYAARPSGDNDRSRERSQDRDRAPSTGGFDPMRSEVRPRPAPRSAPRDDLRDKRFSERRDGYAPRAPEPDSRRDRAPQDRYARDGARPAYNSAPRSDRADAARSDRPRFDGTRSDAPRSDAARSDAPRRPPQQRSEPRRDQSQGQEGLRRQRGN